MKRRGVCIDTIDTPKSPPINMSRDSDHNAHNNVILRSVQGREFHATMHFHTVSPEIWRGFFVSESADLGYNIARLPVIGDWPTFKNTRPVVLGLYFRVSGVSRQTFA